MLFFCGFLSDLSQEEDLKGGVGEMSYGLLGANICRNLAATLGLNNSSLVRKAVFSDEKIPIPA